MNLLNKRNIYLIALIGLLMGLFILIIGVQLKYNLIVMLSMIYIILIFGINSYILSDGEISWN